MVQSIHMNIGYKVTTVNYETFILWSKIKLKNRDKQLIRKNLCWGQLLSLF